MTTLDTLLDLKARISRSIIGQEQIVERLLVGLLANGHLLVEGLPGLAKTRAVKSLASQLDAGLSRVQFTPDLLPSDVTGTEILHTEGGQNIFRFQQGPIFNNLILADEINRAPAKVQAALLEAMEERQVTVAGTTHKLPRLFMVMATQNPIEQEGTYPLPEAQMDRFLMHVQIGYPDEAAEAQIIRLVRGEESEAAAQSPESSDRNVAEPAAIPEDAVFAARGQVHSVHVSETIEKYMVDLVFATRYPERHGEPLSKWIQVGASPRGALGLDRCARAYAWLTGDDHVTPDHVREIVHDVLRHRLMLTYGATAAGVTADQVIDELVKVVAVA
jgi:MoxR-like ATPase